jgi:hypothetical protein
MLHGTALQALGRSDVHRAFPFWLVTGTPNCRVADMNDVRFPPFKGADFIQTIETFSGWLRSPIAPWAIKGLWLAQQQEAPQSFASFQCLMDLGMVRFKHITAIRRLHQDHRNQRLMRQRLEGNLVTELTAMFLNQKGLTLPVPRLRQTLRLIS